MESGHGLTIAFYSGLKMIRDETSIESDLFSLPICLQFGQWIFIITEKLYETSSNDLINFVFFSVWIYLSATNVIYI